MIIAIDPGQHTGLAFRLDNGEWATLMADKLPDDEERLNLVLSTVAEHLERNTTTAVVVENFKTMGYLSRYGIETIELVGAIKALCYVYDVKLVRQDPSHRKAFEQDAKKMVKDRSGKTGFPMSDHEVSALAHLLRYEYSQKPRTQAGAVRRPLRPSLPQPAGLAAITVTPVTVPIPQEKGKA